MNYIKVIEETVKAFAYWEQTALILCGIALGYCLRVAVFKLYIRSLSKRNKDRNLVVIKQHSRSDGTKRDENARYFEYIKSAQYSPEEWQKTKNKGWE